MSAELPAKVERAASNALATEAEQTNALRPTRATARGSFLAHSARQLGTLGGLLALCESAQRRAADDD
jgi:hypothetical protein